MEALFEVFFPPACVACGEVLPARGFFCEACAHEVVETPLVRCRVCAEPGQFPDGRCGRCSRAAPVFTHAFAPFEHEGAVARAIHRFKYEDSPDLARPLAGLLASKLAGPAAGVLCPIPLHAARFRERKFDQATLLAVELARATRWELDDSLLTRVRATQRQVGLDDAGREANVRGAFEAAATAKGKSVVLVDDVYTTGATANEAARALLQRGASAVSVLTLARARRELPAR